MEEIRKQRDTYKQLLNSYQSRDSNAQFFTSTPGFKTSSVMPPSPDQPDVSSSAGEKRAVNLAAKSEQQRENQELLQKLCETSASLEKLQNKFYHYQAEMNNMHK